jgi:hypothetical protein
LTTLAKGQKASWLLFLARIALGYSRRVSQALGCMVDYNATDQTVTIAASP